MIFVNGYYLPRIRFVADFISFICLLSAAGSGCCWFVRSFVVPSSDARGSHSVGVGVRWWRSFVRSNQPTSLGVVCLCVVDQLFS